MEAEIVKLVLPISRRRDHIQGPDTAPATLLEYGDYECPFCGQAYPIIKQLQKALAKNLRFVFRNFPLTQVHPHAEPAERQLNQLVLKENFGRCTISYTRINRYSMVIIYCNMQIL